MSEKEGSFLEIGGFDEVVKKVNLIDEKMVSRFVAPNEFEFVARNPIEVQFKQEKEFFCLSDWALGQYLSLTGTRMSMSYARQQLLYNRQDLLVANLEAFPLAPKIWTFRLYNDLVVGILSPSYQHYRSIEFLDDILASLIDGSGIWRVITSDVSEWGISTYLVEEKTFFRDFHLGLKFVNSEVGLSSIGASITLFTPSNRKIVFEGISNVSFLHQAHKGKYSMREKICFMLEQIPLVADKIQQAIVDADKPIDLEKELLFLTKAVKLSDKRKEELLSKFKLGKLTLNQFLEKTLEFSENLPLLREDFEKYAGQRLTRV